MRLVSNWTAHALEFRTSGDLSYFSEFDSENDKGYLVESRGRLDLARRTNLQGLLSHELPQESRSALDARSAGTRANQIVDRAEAAFNHRFNRLSLQLRGSANDYSFGRVENLGLKTSNADRDYTAYEETVRAAWEFKPTLSVFTEVAVNQRDYGLAAATDNINRSSDGERYRTGLSFGNTGKILRGEISLGYGVQRPDDDPAEVDRRPDHRCQRDVAGDGNDIAAVQCPLRCFRDDDRQRRRRDLPLRGRRSAARLPA